jgi:outer membrane lipoprotein-sorting protein
MPLGRTRLPLSFLCLISALSSSCILPRSRNITRPGAKNSQKLLTTDQNVLIDAIARQYNAVRDFSATVDMVPALGSAEKNQITEYKDFRAYVYFRKPADMHILGLYPVARNRAFDMVSDGTNFKLYVPIRNRFIVGRNEVIQPSKNKIENLRPQHFLDAMMVRPVDPQTDKVTLLNLTDEQNDFYLLILIHEAAGHLRISRSIWFDRTDLQMARQLIFDDAGNILTDARYSQWHAYDNVPFPKHIEINRPQDEYGVVIDIVKMDVNKGVSNDKFELTQPEGTTLQTIGESPAQGPKK